MTVTAYTRASTDRQEMSIQDQLRLIRAHCQAMGYTLTHPERYSDEGLSGTTFEKRPGVMALIADCQAGRNEYQKILILNESRWGRPEDEDDSTFYELLLKRAGVTIEYVQGENHAGVVGRITRSIKYSQASDFSKQLGKDVLRGSRNVVEAGFSPGGLPPFGYARMLYNAAGAPLQLLPPGEHKALKSQKVRWVPGSAEDVAKIRRIFELALDNSLKSICRRFNAERIPSPEGGPWEATTLLYLLKNRAYIGERSYGGSKSSKRLTEKVVCPLAHEPIVDRRMFEEVQEQMAGRGFGRKNQYTKSTYLLTSKLVCLKCGYNFYGKNKYYQCNGYEGHRVCESFLIRRAPIEAFVIDAIKEMVASEPYREALIQFLRAAQLEDSQIKDLTQKRRADLRAIDREIETILDELLKVRSEALRKRLGEKEKQREEARSQFEAAARAPRLSNIEETLQSHLKLLKAAGKALETAPSEEQKKLISHFLEKGEVDRERREVRFYFFALPAARMLIMPLTDSCGSEERRRAALLPSCIRVYQLY